MTNTRSRILTALSLTVVLLLCAPASAQLHIGQPSGFTGSVAAGVKENTDGAKLYFDAINARGGVNGQRIELISVDDRFDPKVTVEAARELITQQKVVALFLNRGTPHAQALLPLLAEYGVPLVGPSTGAMVLHEPVNPGYSTCARPTSARRPRRSSTWPASA
jgi:ABC-type branched-subunit amino acid transport system substrate-binding protein